MSSGSSTVNFACFWFLLVLVFQANNALAGTIVKTLPGFDGELPFTLETGYITVGSAEMFYYFIESEDNPGQDPLLLWYSGGPGCSAFNGLIYEIGPLEFNITDYEGGLPPLSYYPYSWTRTANVLFVDAPVGTGFSYSTTEDGWEMSDTTTGEQVYNFLREWYFEHQRFIKNQLFVGADSYSGISATLVIQNILDANLAGVTPRMNLKGYILGCPRIDGAIQVNSKVVFSHRLALISDELYESAKNACNSDYFTVTSSEAACYEALALIDKCTDDINENSILEPTCTWAFPKPTQELARRALRGNPVNLLRSPFRSNKKWCHTFNYSLSYVWANDATVQAALNITPGTVQDWKRCNESLDYDVNVSNVTAYHQKFSTLGLQALVYNGDHDFVITNVGTIEWITNLGLTIDTDWRPWLVDGQVAGYTIKYENDGYRLTFATVKGAGHSPQEYKRRECYDMFDRFIHYYPL